jgi:ATP/maltotriose-dependent transcriptional regulator MalT
MESALEHAQEHARRAGEEHEPLLILDGLARAAFAGPTPVPAAILRCKQIGEKGAGRRTLQAVVATIQAYLEAMRGRFDEARTLCAQGNGILEELGDVVYLAALQAWTGEIEMLAGDASAAERVRRVAYETLEAIGERGILSTVAAYLAESLHAQGRDEEAERFTARSEEAAATDDVTSQVLWRRTRAKILAQKSEHESAERLARQAVAIATETDYLNLHADALMSMSNVLSAAGRAEEAAETAREALELYEAKGNVVSASRARAWVEDRAVTAAASRDDRAS